MTFSIKKIEISTGKETDYGGGYSEDDVKQFTKGYTNNGLFYERKNGKYIFIIETVN